MSQIHHADIVIVGAGAAGQLAALAARGGLSEGPSGKPSGPVPSVAVLDGSARLGRKILISGGGRCNVTNVRVGLEDYITRSPHHVRAVLAAYSPRDMTEWLESRGVPVREESLGKVFPRSNRAQDVLRSWLDAVRGAGATVHSEQRVESVDREQFATPPSPGHEATPEDGKPVGWSLRTRSQVFRAKALVIATGGKSIPSTGSTGFGFQLAESLGHSLVRVRPALVPLHLSSDQVAGLAGMTHPVILSVVPKGTAVEQISGTRFRPLARSAGSMLFTHQGISGPAALDISSELTGDSDNAFELRADFWSLTEEDSPWERFRREAKPPGACLRSAETPSPLAWESFRATLAGEIREVAVVLRSRLPRRLAEVFLSPLDIPPTTSCRQLSMKQSRRLYEELVHRSLSVTGNAGYAKAEVTAGGVDLSELRRQTLESRHHPGLFFCGEVLDATGRLGGFNFQWAYASGVVAGRGAAQFVAASREA